MSGFNLNSFFNADSAITQVLFGEKRPVMETELNELQEIQDHLRRELVRTLFTDGLITPYNLSYSNGEVRLWNTKVILNGELVFISNLTAALAQGKSIYLEVWREEISHLHTIKKYGNEQETTTIVNKMVDSRMGFETSRRIQIKYRLSTSNTPITGHSFLHLGTVDSNKQLVKNTEIQANLRHAGNGSGGGGGISNVEAHKYQTVVQTKNQTVFNIAAHFNSATDTLMDLAQNGWLLSPSKYTITNGVLTLKEGVAVGTVLSYTVLKNVVTKSINY